MVDPLYAAESSVVILQLIILSSFYFLLIKRFLKIKNRFTQDRKRLTAIFIWSLTVQLLSYWSISVCEIIIYYL